MQLTRSPANEYVPQAGDEVCYFWNGHAVYCQQFPDLRLANGPETKELRDRKPPWELSKGAIAGSGRERPASPDVIRCRVKSIGYEFPQIAAGSALPRNAKLPVRMLLRLEVVGAHAGFSALFHPCEDISEWLVPKRVFLQAQRENCALATAATCDSATRVTTVAT